MTGSELAAKRKAANLTQDQLADKLALVGAQRAQMISAYETGRRPIGPRLERTLELLFASIEGAK